MFQFKQFTIHQERCAMKVGTDGVLLGAWSPIPQNTFSILDIGAGTGLLSLMLAQRSHAEQIDAIEIDENAYEQCVENFEQSPWSDRLFCYHASLLEFVEEFAEESPYDLIISNPPFFSEGCVSPNHARNQARFQESMPFEHLIAAAKTLLSETGIFSTIIPYQEEAHFIAIAKEHQLFCTHKTHVKGTSESPIKRSLLVFEHTPKEQTINTLTLEIKRHEYTDAFKTLVKDFYLKL